ncbi:hypothetical protein D3C77_478170 [compost metagenome]
MEASISHHNPMLWAEGIECQTPGKPEIGSFILCQALWAILDSITSVKTMAMLDWHDPAKVTSHVQNRE